MNELVIKKLEVLEKNKIYIAQCIIVTGKVLIEKNEEWSLKSNPKLKIIFNTPVVTKQLKPEKYLLDFIINEPNFDLSIFKKPTLWIKR